MIKQIFSNDPTGVGHWTTQRIKDYVPRPGAKILDLACGKRKIPGAIGIDQDPQSDADIVMDATGKLPFKDGTVDEVFCLNFLEHTFKFEEVLAEIYRVLKPDGIVHVDVPYYHSFNYAQIPFHYIMFCETTMENFFTKNGQFARYSKAKFKILETELYFTKPARLIPARFRVKAAHYIPNMCYQIYWKLQKD